LSSFSHTRQNMNQRRATGFVSEDPFASSGMDQETRKVSKAYAHKNATPTWMYTAVGIVIGMFMMGMVFWVHKSRENAEIMRHHYHTRTILNKHRLGQKVDDQEHDEMLAKHGMHSTDEDLRMHALEFFENDHNKDAFHAGPDASKGEIESMDKNGDGAVSWMEYLEGFHNEKLMLSQFHHYYGEIYGKGIPNHYHTERHPDAVHDYDEVHHLDEEVGPGHWDYLAPGEKVEDHMTHAERELHEHLQEIEKEEEEEKKKKEKMKDWSK